MSKKIAFVTLGCKLNFAETATYERNFVRNGLEVVSWNEQADLCLVNTCSVTEHSDKKARNIIRKLHRISPSAGIIVTGCYAELKREEIAAIEGVALVFGASEKSSVVPTTMDWLNAHYPSHEEPEDIGTQQHTDTNADILPAWSVGERTRAFLKVQDGCNNFCAYCTVPYARGRSRNIPLCEVVREATEIAEHGIKEIVITGVNTGDFGRSTGESFLSLLEALDKIQGIERYRISSIEPNLLTDEIIAFTQASGKFQPHFHIPLQTGSDILLKSMGRRYDTALFESRINEVRRLWEAPGKPKVFFGIDVIAGLPGETEELLQETFDFLSRIQPAYLHIFPYSKRPGTRAAEMPGQVQESIKTERVKRLEELCKELETRFMEAHKGMQAKVLWEDRGKDGQMYGYTGNYIKVQRPFDPALCGKITDWTI